MAILKNTVIADTGFIQIPTGTAAQRPVNPVIGDFRYNSEEESFEVYNGEDWLAVGSASASGLYEFTTATFTTGGVQGRTGPSLTQARNGLSGSGTETWKNNTEFFNTTNGIQLWTVPQDGTYRIESWGAQGFHRQPESGTRAGNGARMRGDVELTGGEVIRILVGQIGLTGDCAGGGGGGTFVVRAPYNANQSILVIAGGGGGANRNADNRNNSKDGSTGTSGGSTSGSSYSGTGGVNGNGADPARSNTGPGSSGGGFFTDGGPTSFNGSGKSFTNGGFGGSNSGNGGFGGGGAGSPSCWQKPGGGGGYSGGAGVQTTNGESGISAGGGGSFNSGTNQSNTAGARSGAGQVQITLL